jgi:hypothetical protein
MASTVRLEEGVVAMPRFLRTFLGLVALVVSGLILGLGSRTDHEMQVHAWAGQRGYEVRLIRRVVVVHGVPWPRHKDDDLCRVTLGRGGLEWVSFFRWNFGSMEQMWDPYLAGN